MRQMGVITLFPQLFVAFREYGIVGRAVRAGLMRLETWNPRDYARGERRAVDDRPYGGGPGMVMTVEPLREAIRTGRTRLGSGVQVLYLSPQGRRLDQRGVEELAGRAVPLLLVAGRYEGIDERLIELEVDEEWSVGDYVLTGGEPAAMILIDALIRLLPGALGDPESAREDSFRHGLLDYPHYTRPQTVDGLTAPEVLLSGDHERIRRWRLKQALGRTWLRRPDLLAGLDVNEEQRELLEAFRQEYVALERERTGQKEKKSL